MTDWYCAVRAHESLDYCGRLLGSRLAAMTLIGYLALAIALPLLAAHSSPSRGGMHRCSEAP